MGTEVDFFQIGTIVLAPGQVLTGGAAWDFFDSNHWVRWDAVPDSDNSRVEVLKQWAEKSLTGTVRHYATFRNTGKTPVAFRPTLVQVPNKF